MQVGSNLLQDKKVVIVHDWLTAYGGAERVLESMLQVFPDADVFTMLNNLPESESAWLEKTNVIIHQHWLLKRFPKKYRYFLPFMPHWVESFDLREYDLIISSSHAIAKGVIVHPHQLHLAYIYTPIRYAWDLQFEHFERKDFGSGLKSWIIKRWLHKMRIWDAVSFLRPSCVVSTSYFIQKRIKRVCNRDSRVIYPPVNKPNFSIATKILSEELSTQNYYLVISRLVPYKEVKKIVEAFNFMPSRKLVILGDGPQLDELKCLAMDNVMLKGYLSESDKLAYLLNAKAFIHFATEDFGIAPIEAQFAGIPVIGYSKGALSETIQCLYKSNKPTGILFDKQTKESLIEAVECFENQNVINQEYCKENAKKFENKRFLKEFKNAIMEMLEND